MGFVNFAKYFLFVTMKTTYTNVLFLIMAVAIGWVACTKDTDNNNQNNGGGNSQGDGCDTSFVASFQEKVLPILNRNCNGCHSSSAPSAGVVLDNYAASVARASKILPSINHDAGISRSKHMPPGGKLNTCDILTIERWVKNGFPQ
jgi:cytochrome c5